jgi:hypothetical protein
MDYGHWKQLEQIQHYVNDRVRYTDDMQNYGVPEYWEVADRTGDCEDYALAKRQRLMALGWPPEALRIATVVNERGEMHAVLTVDVSYANGRQGTYVLDNRFADVEPWQELIGYRWIERQGPNEYVWTRIGGPMNLQVATTAVSMNVAMVSDPVVDAAVAAGMAAASTTTAASAQGEDPVLAAAVAVGMAAGRAALSPAPLAPQDQPSGVAAAQGEDPVLAAAVAVGMAAGRAALPPVQPAAQVTPAQIATIDVTLTPETPPQPGSRTLNIEVAQQ